MKQPKDKLQPEKKHLTDPCTGKTICGVFSFYWKDRKPPKSESIKDCTCGSCKIIWKRENCL